MFAKLRNVAKVLLLVGISILVACSLGEVLIRYTIKDQVVLFPRFHTDVQYGEFRIRRFVPNLTFQHSSIDGTWQFRINAQGFRNDRDFSYSRQENGLRILTLGDSHTAGYEVSQDQTYSSITESLLVNGDIDAEVFNTGISGFGTAEELVYFENEGIRYKPDVVVLGFYANDFEDNIKSGLFTIDDNKLRLLKKEHIPGIRIQNQLNSNTAVRWLSQNSYFYSFTFNTVYELAKVALARATKQEIRTEYAVATGKFSDYEYELSNALLTRLYDFCRTNNIFLIILDIPIPTENNTIVSSIPPELQPVFEANSDILIKSTETLQRVVNSGALVHVPHGHRHISADSHAAFGNAIFDVIRRRKLQASD